MNKPDRRCHKDLILWQKAMDLTALVYQASFELPKAELFGLTSQLRRAGTSIPSNIAEGSARRSTREFLYFLHVARGSMSELETQVLLAGRVGYLSSSSVAELQSSIDDVGRILSSVITGLRRRLGQHSDYPLSPIPFLTAPQTACHSA
jgi:four helix bundle protein